MIKYWYSTRREEKVTEKEQTAGDKFTDITNHWASDAIKAVVNKGLFSGTSEVTFSPDKEMTRGMFVTVLGRLSGENISGTATFTDVDNQFIMLHILRGQIKMVL